MSVSSTLDRLHSRARANRWLWLFSIFCRVSLAAGFIPSGLVKIMDERFASGLSANHPMGHYLEALHLTGYYYTFIGVVQITAAVMLLVPRTVTLGAFLYLPIILNITILTYATRFDGSLFTAPLMTMANLFVLAWNYEKWKYVLPFNRLPSEDRPRLGLVERLRNFVRELFRDRFPVLFFAGVFAIVVLFVIGIPSLYSLKPRNTFPQCIRQFKDTKRTQAGEQFCHCIHTNGEPLNKCLNGYNAAADDGS